MSTGIPDMTDLLEVRNMLEEHRLEWWEQWKQEGWVEGRREGMHEGRLEGILEGRREGTLEGRREGLLQGRAEGKLAGKQQGILEGEARVLHRLLGHRFGPLPAWVDARLAKATEEDLVRWSELTLDPTLSLEETLRT